MSYRHLLWDHRPLTDFWRVAARRPALEPRVWGTRETSRVARSAHVIARKNEDLLYNLSG